MNNIKKTYYNTAHPAGFTSFEPLKRHLHISKSKIKTWLQGENAYTLHKQIVKKFPRNRYIVYNIDDLFQADLIDLKSIKDFNDGYQYILMVIDVFSKYAWAQPLKNKNSTCMVQAFKNIFDTDNRIPLNLQTDKGKEFLDSKVQQFLSKHDVNFFVAKNPDLKACIVERLNRTIKTRMFKFFTHNNTYRYIDVLNDIIKAYNNSFHRTIKTTPSQVNSENVLEVWNTAYKPQLKPVQTKPVFKCGDFVRITRFKHVFEKGYERGWSDEIFKVIQVIKRTPVVYKISDLDNETIDGTYYTQELQKVTYLDTAVFKIDKIISKRGFRGSRELLVSWQGYPKKFNQWVKASELYKI